MINTNIHTRGQPHSTFASTEPIAMDIDVNRDGTQAVIAWVNDEDDKLYYQGNKRDGRQVLCDTHCKNIYCFADVEYKQGLADIVCCVQSDGTAYYYIITQKLYVDGSVLGNNRPCSDLNVSRSVGGSYLVATWVCDGRVYAKIYNPEQSQWGPTCTIDDQKCWMAPKGVVSNSGQALIMYQGNGADLNVKCAFDFTGNKKIIRIDSACVFYSGLTRPFDIAMDGGGNHMVVYFKRNDSAVYGNLACDPNTKNFALGAGSEDPRVVMPENVHNAPGCALWMSRESPLKPGPADAGIMDRLYARTFDYNDLDLSKYGGPTHLQAQHEPINKNGTTMKSYNVAMSPGGRAAAIWRHYNQVPQYGLCAILYNPAIGWGDVNFISREEYLRQRIIGPHPETLAGHDWYRIFPMDDGRCFAFWLSTTTPEFMMSSDSMFLRANMYTP